MVAHQLRGGELTLFPLSQTNECCYYLSQAHPTDLWQTMALMEKNNTSFSEGTVRLIAAQSMLALEAIHSLKYIYR